MNKQFAIGAALLLFGTGIVGCSNTAEGAKEDTAKNASAVKDTADSAAKTVDDTAKATANAAGNAADAAGKAVANTADAAGKAVANTADAAATPKVKMALAADEELSKPGNAVINVDTHDGKVILRGHVKTADMKKKAEAITKKVIEDAKYTDTVQNTLTVDSH